MSIQILGFYRKRRSRWSRGFLNTFQLYQYVLGAPGDLYVESGYVESNTV